MPEDAYISLQGLLNMLEGLQNSPDSEEYANKNHLNILKSIMTMLGRGEEVTSTDADRVLKLCLHYKTDVPCVTHMVSIISSLINIDKTKPFSPPFDFIQSSIIILDFLKILCEEPQAIYQRTLAIQILMLHPADALTELIRHHCSEVVQIFMICVNQKMQGTPGLEFKMEPAMLLQLLVILPDAEKAMFIKEGIPVWFRHVIPNMIQYLVVIDNTVKQEQYLEKVELMVQELVVQDYYQYPEWQTMLENICNPNMFPSCIQLLLEKANHSWHRVWIFIIKLLKAHITRNYGSYGTPINSMLPVVETAFKKEAIERVRAFKCWDELIENFSHETTVNTIGKRMKLLMIPLRLNNAKMEETAAAKLQTWWHLIRTFKPKLDRFIKDVLISFLHFMFGKDQTSSKPIFWVGQLASDHLRKQCLEAFVEIVGHSDCTSACVTSMSTLNGRILDITMLIDHWDHWYYALKVAIRVAARTYSPGAKANIRCVWKSLAVLVADLPDNTVRRDLFIELVKLLSDLIQDCSLYSDLEDVLIDDLMLPLFNDMRIQNLLKTKSQAHRPMHNIVMLMACKAFDEYYKRFPSEDLMYKLKPLATTLAAEAWNPLYTTWFLENLPKTDSSLKIWTALVQVLTESEMENCLTVLKSVLLWPFKSLDSFSDVEQPSLSWNKLYNIVHIKLNAIGFHNDLLEALPKENSNNEAVNYFTMFAYISILKHKLLNVDNMKMLEKLTSKMTVYRDFKEVIPPLVDSLVVMLDHVTTSVDESMAQTTINCVINVIRIIINEIKTESTTDTTESAYDKSFLLGSLLWHVTSLFKVNIYSSIIINVVNELKQLIPSLKQGTVTATILSNMKTCLYNCSNELVNTEIRYLISLLEKSIEKHNITNEFTSPNKKEVKKSKKKEDTIVNTVVENGEEYIVVKSNWKFNPKNLTEHQKEKLTRKRDIPALYQDLSQSQDEFKLSSWKTDSQDTSLSSSKSSKSAANNEASEILKNMRSTSVVPKIMENILLDNDKNVSLQKPDTVQSLVSNDKLGIEEILTTPKGTKSPRMAFKDRVFRNVRNLIEKSSPQIECKINNKDDQVENISKSPVRMKIEVAKSSMSKSHVYDTVTKYDAQINQNSTDVSNTLIKKVNSDNLPISTKKAANSVDAYVTLNTNHMVNSAIQDTNNLVDVCSTPVTKQKSETNVTNSAPHHLADRPARMKRKPKKYENSQLYALKKKRLSQSDSQARPQIESQPEITIAQIHNTEDKSNINNQPQSIVHHQSDANEESNLDKYQKIIVDDDSVESEEIQTCFVIQDENFTESQICEAVDEVTLLKLDTAPQIRAEDEGGKNDSKKGKVSSKTITTPFNKIKSKAQIVLAPIQICNHSETNKINTETVTTPLNEVVDILNKSLTSNNDLQDDNNERVELVSETVNNDIANMNSSQKTLARPSVLAVEKLEITEKQYSGPDCETIGILENLSDNKQFNIQSTIVKDIRNQQKALTNNSLVHSGVHNNIERSDIHVNKIVVVKVPQCYVVKKIDNETGKDTHFNTVTLLNKVKDGGQEKCSTNKIDMMDNNEISDLSSVKTKDKDVTQLSKKNCKVNETHINQEKISITPSKEIKMNEDDLDKSSPKTSKRQLVVIVEKIREAELQDLIKDCGQVVTPDKPANTMRRVGRPKSSEKLSFEQHNSKGYDEKQFTPIQNIRSQQKAETSDTSTPINKAIDLHKPKSAMKRNVVDTPLNKNKNQMKADESEMNKEISDLSIAITKDATQPSKQICMENERNKSQEIINIITDPIPLKEVEMDDLEKSSGNNNDVQNNNNSDRTEEVSNTNITTISVRSTKKTPSRQVLVDVDKIKVTGTQDCEKVGTPAKHINKMRRGRPKSIVKTSFGQDNSKGDNEQFDKLLTPVKNIRNQQKAEPLDKSTSVNKAIDLHQPKSAMKRNVFDTPLNKEQTKADASEMNREISDLTIANTKDRDATQLSKKISKENERNKTQETMNTITDPLPLKEVKMDDLEKSSINNNDVQNYNKDRTEEVSNTNLTTIRIQSTKKTPSRQLLVAVDKIKVTETQDRGKVGTPAKLANKMRRGRPKSIVKTSFGQDHSKGDNEQFDKLLTPVKNIRNQQKAETSDTSTSVNEIVNQLKSCVKNNVVNNETGQKENADINSPSNKSIDEIKANECEMSKKNVTLDLTRLTSTTEVKNATEKISTNNSSKKSRIEKQLRIEMVEGHPFLEAQSEKRMTRKKLMEIENRSRRKSISEKLQMAKLHVTPKAPKRSKEKKPSPSTSTSITVEKSQERRSNTPENFITDACSEDFIESSQDSNITALSVKSTKKTPTRLPIIVDDKLKSTETQDLIRDCENIQDITEKNHDYESIEDISLPHNKTAETDTIDLTENMDTEPMTDDNLSKDLDELEPSPIADDSEHAIGPATQESANAAVTKPKGIPHWEFFEVLNIFQPDFTEKARKRDPQKAIIEDQVDLEDDNDRTQTLPDDAIAPEDVENTTDVSSPFKGDDQRKQDFLNNTLEISPIRVQSPDRENISLTPETSNDFVVIKLTSPVHSNGEPFEKNGSPEFFTEEKISPDKRDESPLRAKTSVINTSPSSSLSLKKRHQVRPSGRAAQMLGLLSVSSDNMLKITKNSDRLELEEPKKSNTSSPARRNLRILYSSVGENCDMIESKIGDVDENILKLKRALPTVTSSPSGSILKRKHVDTTDEATTSPASKRKRVSFHDPPVSTTVSVYKYIEPLGIRSPQSSAKKRHEKSMRSGVKSPKRLDTAFHLDSVLSKTVESFDMNSTETADTYASLDITPAVEIVKTSELNDTDPICPDLVDCKDPIDVISVELSSPAMRDLLVKELQGKVETVGDLAKMTELEVNRLCIKAPKVKVVNNVLSLYATKPSTIEVEPVTDEALGEMETLPITTSVEMPTNVIEVSDIEMQMVSQPAEISPTQTKSVPAAHTSAKIDEPGSRTASEVITSCLSEKAEFIQEFKEVLEKSSTQTNCEKLPANSLPDLAKESSSSMINIMDRVMELHNKYHGDDTDNSELAFLRDYLCLRYGDKVLILFCSQLLQKIGGTFCR